MNLQQQSDKLTQDFLAQSPLKIVENIQMGFEEIINRKLDRHALSTGDIAPDFSLPNANHQEITLTKELKKGTVVVTFYRGGWCPFCNLQLRAYQQILDRIQSLGASLIAISPELPDNSLSTQEKNELQFEVLSDRENLVAQEYGLVFTTPEAHQKAHLDLDIPLPEINGDDSWKIPITATYIIDRNRTIAWSHTNPNYRQRAEPEEILQALTSLQQVSPAA